jgi:hypothetical protein
MQLLAASRNFWHSLSLIDCGNRSAAQAATASHLCRRKLGKEGRPRALPGSRAPQGLRESTLYGLGSECADGLHGELPQLTVRECTGILAFSVLIDFTPLVLEMDTFV